MQKIQTMTILMPYGEVGTTVSWEYDSENKILDAQILQGEVTKVDNYTLEIKTTVKPKTYTTDLLIRTTTGLQTVEVKTRV